MTDYVLTYPPAVDDPGYDLVEHRRFLLERDGLYHYATIGYFFQWFGGMESHFDRLLCWASGAHDFAAFGDLIKNMSPRAKIERLRTISKRNNITIGPNFAARIKHFEGPILTVRNYLAHRFILHDKQTDIIELRSMQDLSSLAQGGAFTAKTVHSLTLFEHGAFLHLFTMDMKQVTPDARKTHGVTLEITAPTSSLPKAIPQQTPQLAPPANADTPPPPNEAS